MCEILTGFVEKIEGCLPDIIAGKTNLRYIKQQGNNPVLN